MPSVLAKAADVALSGKLTWCRLLAVSQQELASLEGRLSQAEQAEGDGMRAVREAEAAAVDQEGLLLRAAALEDKLKESRAEQGQLENYKQVSSTSSLCFLNKQGIPCLLYVAFLFLKGELMVLSGVKKVTWTGI